MRLLLWLGLALVSIGAIVMFIGWLLPVAHTASREVVLPAPPAAVYSVISDVEHYPAWWADVSAVEMLPSEPGRVRFREHMSSGPIVMEVQHAAPPSQFVTRIADPGQPFGGTWTFDIAPHGSGTRLTVTERGEIYNPVFRFMARFVFGYTSTLERCVRAVAAKT